MVRFNQQAFNRHLDNMGQQILWQSAYACSCYNTASGAADPKCRLCKGKGRIWDPAKKTVCGICKQETQSEWADSGLWEQGDLVVTIPEQSPMWDSGQFDRVTMLNAQDRFSMPFEHGAPTEMFLFIPTKIDRVFWRHPQTQALVEGGIPKIQPDGTPVWTTGEPPLGMKYSITGWRNSEYFVFGNFPSSRNQHSGMRLPKRVVLRRWDLFGR